MITFTVPGVPKAKGRARSFFKRGGGIGHKTPPETAAYERLVAGAALQAMARTKTIAAGVQVNLTLNVYMPVPKSWSKAKQLAAVEGDIRPTGRPDLDNIIKAIADGCNQIVWADDAQIVSISASKYYGVPRVVVMVTAIA